MSPLLEHFGGSPMRIREYECWEFKIKEMVSVATAEAETDQGQCSVVSKRTWANLITAGDRSFANLWLYFGC